MKKQNLIIGIGVASLVLVGFFVLKNKKEKIVETDAEVEFENANGKTSNTPLKVVKVKDYQNLLLNTNLEKVKKDLIGKNIYTSIANVKIRNKPNVLGIFNSNNWFNRFTIKNKGSFIGQVGDVISEENGKRYYLAISEKGYNKKYYDYLVPFLNTRNKPTKYKNWVLANNVVVDLNK
jgi:hypothetical protein